MDQPAFRRLGRQLSSSLGKKLNAVARQITPATPRPQGLPLQPLHTRHTDLCGNTDVDLLKRSATTLPCGAMTASSSNRRHLAKENGRTDNRADHDYFSTARGCARP